MVALEKDYHPLVGVKFAYYINMREPIEAITSPWRRFFIRLVYFKWKYFSGAAVHDMGIFTDRDVAEELAAMKRKETGMAWSVKELPVNALLPEVPVRYGFYSFPGSKYDYKYRKRTGWLHAVEPSTLQLAQELKTKVGEFASFVRDG
jgi:hypothetical protein